MALEKTPLSINFSQGLDLKTDPYQVTPGKFLVLENTVFDKGGRLQKRNGYGDLTALPDLSSTFLTTFNGNLTAIGSNLQAYSQPSSAWVNKGHIQPAKLDTLPIIRSTTNQTYADSAIAPNGLVCTVFTDSIPVAGTPTNFYKYAITDSTTGQNIVAPTVITPTSGALVGSQKVFVLGNHFVIVYSVLISGTNHLQYIAISTAVPTNVGVSVDISSQYTPESGGAFDGFVANNSLYLAWNGSDLGGAIRMTSIDSSLLQHNTQVFAGKRADLVSVTVDETQVTPVVYVSFYDNAGTKGYALSTNQNLVQIFAPTQIFSQAGVLNITAAAQNRLLSVFYEVSNNYTYDSSIATHYISKVTVTSAGTPGTPAILLRSVGLASKAVINDSEIYLLVIYSSPFQPTDFLINSSGQVVLKLAQSSAGAYLSTGLPNATISQGAIKIAYLTKDLVEAVNKVQGVANAAAIYSQTGINLASIVITTAGLSVAEIGSNLNLSGGILWMYDGYLPVEQGFHLWPDSVEVTTATTGGSISDQQYFYQAVYEWADNQGNIFRSAPSVPVSITAAGGNTSTNTVYVPTARLTYKLSNPIKIVIYRWSVAQQVYYQVTSILNPLLNDVTVDYVTFTDTFSDSDILGNSIIYTTGGVIENIAAPANDTLTLFKSRLFLIDAEDKNLLWFSKQVIENTPVEMNDGFTLYVAPTTAAQGNTGPMLALSALDDKLIIFKKNAIYYITGTGPDNLGSNNDFSEPVFITSTVGCDNQASIVFTPNGLIFQSDKGLWMLGRDLSTSYIGAAVEDFNGSVVKSAINVPETNQVRFTLDTGQTLMYDYYFGQWGTFANVPGISSTIYQDLHTYINSNGLVRQETPGHYLDGDRPVLMSFTTSWFNLMGLQGFQRAYYFYLLATFISPHKLNVSVAYDYDSNPVQRTIISPDNYSRPYGNNAPLYGNGSPYGGHGSIEQERIFFQRQKCEAFQISISEIYDPTLGAAAGAGLTMSGLNMQIGTKAGQPKLRAARSWG